ncbi:MAG: glutamate racemase [Candidatus Babeliales bacterium]
MKKKVINKIGFLDSGLGGLTILKKFLEYTPSNYLYLADIKNIPYGQKTPEQLKKIALANVDFLLLQGVEAIIIACHTLTAHTIDYLRARYPELPIIGVIKPVIQSLCDISAKKIGIIATTATIQSNIYYDLLQSLNQFESIFQQACPDLVPLIEAYPMNQSAIKNKLIEYLQSLKKENIDCLILGCTHYSLIKYYISELLPDCLIIGAERQMVDYSSYYFSIKNIPKLNCDIFVTQYSNAFEQNCLYILGDKIQICKIK